MQKIHGKIIDNKWLFFAKQKHTFLCVSGWSISRVLSFKTIINLVIILLLCSSGHGNGRTALCVPHLAPHGVYSKLLSPISWVSSYLTFSPLPEGCIFLLHFSSGYPGLTLSSVIVLWCSDFPHHCWRDCLTNWYYYITNHASSQVLYVL